MQCQITLPTGFGWLANPTFWSAFWLVDAVYKLLSFTGEPVKSILGIYASAICQRAFRLCGGLITSMEYGHKIPDRVSCLCAYCHVRRAERASAAGMQARILNQMVDELFKEHKFSAETR